MHSFLEIGDLDPRLHPPSSMKSHQNSRYGGRQPVSNPDPGNDRGFEDREDSGPPDGIRARQDGSRISRRVPNSRLSFGHRFATAEFLFDVFQRAAPGFGQVPV